MNNDRVRAETNLSQKDRKDRIRNQIVCYVIFMLAIAFLAGNSQSAGKSNYSLSSEYSERELDQKLQREEKREEDGMRRGLRDEAKFDYAALKRQAVEKQKLAREKADADLSHYGQLLSFEDPDDQQKMKRPLQIHEERQRVPAVEGNLHVHKNPPISDLRKKFQEWEAQHRSGKQPLKLIAQSPHASPNVPLAPEGLQDTRIKRSFLTVVPIPEASSSTTEAELQHFNSVLREGQADLAALAAQMPPPQSSAAPAGPLPLERDEAALSGLLSGALMQLRGISALAASQGFSPADVPAERAAPLHAAPALEEAAQATTAHNVAQPGGSSSLSRRFGTSQPSERAAAGPAAALSYGEVFRRALAQTAAALAPPTPPPHQSAAAHILAIRSPPPPPFTPLPDPTAARRRLQAPRPQKGSVPPPPPAH